MRLKTSFFAETTSKILVLASDGKVYTLDASKLPGGRGQGEPIRLMADIDESASIVAVWPYVAGREAAHRRLATATASSSARTSFCPRPARAGRSLNVTAPATAALIVPADGDHVAVIGQNRKLLVFPASQVNEMARGKGMRLQRYKDGGVSDAKVFALADGLTWRDRPGAPSPSRSPTSRNGSAIAPKPGDCRRRGFRRTIALRGRDWRVGSDGGLQLFGENSERDLPVRRLPLSSLSAFLTKTNAGEVLI